jgi:hypothetical protein
MPNTPPTISDANSLAEKHAIACVKAHVDYSLYAVPGEDSIPNVDELLEGGIIGFKHYMGNTFGRIASPTTGAMLEAFVIIAPTGTPIQSPPCRWRSARSFSRPYSSIPLLGAAPRISSGQSSTLPERCITNTGGARCVGIWALGLLTRTTQSLARETVPRCGPPARLDKKVL